MSLEFSASCGTAVCVDLAKLEHAKPKPQNQLLLFAKCEPKSCAHECNYVLWLPIQPVKEVYHIIIFMCTAFWFTFCKVNANRCIDLGVRLILCDVFTPCRSVVQAQYI